jgi:hypothetical protein
MSLEHFQIPLPDHCIAIRTVSVVLGFVEGHRVLPFIVVSDTVLHAMRRHGRAA